METWLTANPNPYFSLQNLPFGVFEHGCCTRIGNNVINLTDFEKNYFPNKLGFQSIPLNNFISLGKKHWSFTICRLAEPTVGLGWSLTIRQLGKNSDQSICHQVPSEHQ